MSSDTVITVRSPAELIAAMPFVLGFHPRDSLVVAGIDGGRVTFSARYDLPPPAPPDPGRPGGPADVASVAMLVVRQGVRTAVVIGYGPPAVVTPVVPALVEALRRRQVPVADALRVTDERFWSYLCTDPLCCPADGFPCLPPGNVVAVQAIVDGQVALPDRAALAVQVAPVDGAARTAMTAATRRSRQRLAEICGDDPAMYRAGRTAVRAAERAQRSGRRLTDDEVAWLALVLADQAVLDHALVRAAHPTDERVRLWIDVVRRADPGDVTGAACVLAFAGWCAGRGTAARAALDRVPPDHRGQEMPSVLDRLLAYGIGPGVLRPLPMQRRARLIRGRQR